MIIAASASSLSAGGAVAIAYNESLIVIEWELLLSLCFS